MIYSTVQLVAHSILVSVALLALVIYTSAARVSVYSCNRPRVRDPTSSLAEKHPRLFFRSIYVLIIFTTISQVIWTTMSWIKGDLWLNLSLDTIFMTNIIRECLWLKCLLPNRMTVIGAINRRSSSFGLHYASSIFVSFAALNFGLFGSYLPLIVRNIAMISSAIVYSGQLCREWWKLFRQAQEKTTALLTLLPLLINMLLCGISTGVLLCLASFGHSVQPIYILTLICWCFVIKDYARICLQRYDNREQSQEPSIFSQNSTTLLAPLDYEIQRPERAANIV